MISHISNIPFAISNIPFAISNIPFVISDERERSYPPLKNNNWGQSRINSSEIEEATQKRITARS